ncbi:unnamed protein product [Ranitomeya imitator]|uniref:Uncharacterized protein n=1 Tax=Ranitomeya imitator TaxID=111125 RepID=A0ABN9LTY9_9NEOB|nr:unnamed protein product [Ranitomeya imitator]
MYQSFISFFQKKTLLGNYQYLMQDLAINITVTLTNFNDEGLQKTINYTGPHKKKSVQEKAGDLGLETVIGLLEIQLHDISLSAP